MENKLVDENKTVLNPDVKDLFHQFAYDEFKTDDIPQGSPDSFLQLLNLIEFVGGDWRDIWPAIQRYIWQYWQDHGTDDFIVQTAKYHLRPWYFSNTMTQIEMYQIITGIDIPVNIDRRTIHDLSIICQERDDPYCWHLFALIIIRSREGADTARAILETNWEQYNFAPSRTKFFDMTNLDHRENKLMELWRTTNYSEAFSLAAILMFNRDNANDVHTKKHRDSYKQCADQTRDRVCLLLYGMSVFVRDPQLGIPILWENWKLNNDEQSIAVIAGYIRRGQVLHLSVEEKIKFFDLDWTVNRNLDSLREWVKLAIDYPGTDIGELNERRAFLLEEDTRDRLMARLIDGFRVDSATLRGKSASELLDLQRKLMEEQAIVEVKTREEKRQSDTIPE
jgi:hypothetical protein